MGLCFGSVPGFVITGKPSHLLLTSSDLSCHRNMTPFPPPHWSLSVTVVSQETESERGTCELQSTMSGEFPSCQEFGEEARPPAGAFVFLFHPICNGR